MDREIRMETARAMLRADALRMRQELSPDARLLYVYGLMVCDEHGRIPRTAIEAPWDAAKEADARILCAEFNLLGVDN